VTLADQVGPRPESTLRHVISPADFLDTLFWGRYDPKAAMLLERALELEREHGAFANPVTISTYGTIE
jgi:hypothetical protein